VFKPLVGAGTLAAGLVLALACTDHHPVQVSPRSPGSIFLSPPLTCPDWYPPHWSGYVGGDPPPEAEEEVFGAITRAATASWSATLEFRDTPTQVNQAGYFSGNENANFQPSCLSSNQGGHANAEADWGWYGFGNTFHHQCDLVSDKTQNDPERHRAETYPFPADYERHCVNAGFFTLTLSRAGVPAFVRPIDFIPYLPYGNDWIEDTNTFRYPGDANHDVRVNVSEVVGGTISPTMELSVARTPYDLNWTSPPFDAGYLRAPSNFFLRVRTSGVAQDEVLVRFFWDLAGNISDRSGFTDVTVGGTERFIRVKRFTQGIRTVRMQVVQPFERPLTPTDVESSNYGVARDTNFSIYAALDVSIAPNPGSVVVLNPLQFSDAGSNGAGSNTYQWDFGDGSSLSTVASPSHTYTTPGAKTVTLTKGDRYGFTSTGTSRISVTDPPPTNLVASNITGSGATIGWTIGNPAGNTTIQQRVAGTSTWLTAGTVGPTINTLALTGLSSCTSYDVNAFHVNAATAALTLFRTTGGNSACAPSNFTLVSCSDTTIRATVYRSYNVAWTRGEFSTGSTYEIGQANTNDPGGAAVITSGPSTKTGAVLGLYSRSQSQLLYFWVRHKLSGGTAPSAWVLLDNAPENPAGACF